MLLFQRVKELYDIISDKLPAYCKYEDALNGYIHDRYGKYLRITKKGGSYEVALGEFQEYSVIFDVNKDTVTVKEISGLIDADKILEILTWHKDKLVDAIDSEMTFNKEMEKKKEILGKELANL